MELVNSRATVVNNKNEHVGDTTQQESEAETHRTDWEGIQYESGASNNIVDNYDIQESSDETIENDDNNIMITDEFIREQLSLWVS